MTTPRETVMSALVAQLATVSFAQPVAGSTTWQLLQRKVLTFDQINPGMQPACCVADHAEDWAWTTLTVHKVSLMTELFIYIWTKGAMNPGQWLNIIEDALMAALAPPSGSDRQTLNGNVYQCRIKGRVLKDPGDIDGQALMLVPVELLLP